jgi:hypothetical protein
MSLRSQFTDSEWSTLEKTPVWAFVMTAASDGKVDKKEIAAFAKELAETQLYKDELAREVFGALTSHLDNVLPGCVQGAEQVLAGLGSAGRILDSKCPEHADEFKGSVLLICKNVAEASGGLFRRDKMSDSEKTAIVVIAGALGMKLS